MAYKQMVFEVFCVPVQGEAVKATAAEQERLTKTWKARLAK